MTKTKGVNWGGTDSEDEKSRKNSARKSVGFSQAGSDSEDEMDFRARAKRSMSIRHNIKLSSRNSSVGQS
jgi:hypothetical protein